MTPTIKEQIMAVAGLPEYKTNKLAVKYSNEWADFSLMSEEDQNDTIYAYEYMAEQENHRLLPLINALAECVQALEYVFPVVEKHSFGFKGAADEAYMCNALAKLKVILEGNKNE